MPRYNHAFDIAFEVITDHPGDEVTAEELLGALLARTADLAAGNADIIEACGLPFDTFEYSENER